MLSASPVDDSIYRSRPMNGFQMKFLFSLGHPGSAHASGTALEGLDAGVNSTDELRDLSVE